MFCMNCGKEIETETIFCTSCGSRQNGNATNNQNDSMEWFYIKDNNRQGPCNIDSVTFEINNGGIKRDTLVWQKGMQNWLPAEQTSLSNFLHKIVPPIPDEVVDNKYVWALATVPILVSCFVSSLFNISSLTTIIAVILNVVFFSLDISILKKSGKNVENWIWIGIVLVPLYLFIRASKTDKKYAYGITWCVMFVIDLFL